MKRNTDSINAVAAYLALKATATDGISQAEIANEIGLDRTTVGRILRSHPGFKRSIKPMFPYGYYFDISEPLAFQTPVSKPTKPKPVVEPKSNPVAEMSRDERSALYVSMADVLTRMSKGEYKPSLKEVNNFIQALKHTADLLESQISEAKSE